MEEFFVIPWTNVYPVSLKCKGKKVRGRSSMYSISYLLLDFYKCEQKGTLSTKDKGPLVSQRPSYHHYPFLVLRTFFGELSYYPLLLTTYPTIFHCLLRFYSPLSLLFSTTYPAFPLSSSLPRSGQLIEFQTHW